MPFMACPVVGRGVADAGLLAVCCYCFLAMKINSPGYFEPNGLLS
jgi:hypothetical protein